MCGKGPRWTHPRLLILTCFVTSPGLTERGRARRRDTSGVVAGRMGDTGRIADPQMGSGVADGRARVRDASQTRPRAQQWSVYQERCRGWREGCRLTGPWGPPQPSLLAPRTLIFLPPREVPELSPGGPWGHVGSVSSRN